MPTPPLKKPRRGLFVRVAVLSTLLVLLSVGPCAFFFIRQHCKAEWESMEAQAITLARTVANAAAAQHPAKDDNLRYHCYQLLAGPSNVDFIITVPVKANSRPHIFYKPNKDGPGAENEWRPKDTKSPIVLQRAVSHWTGEPVIECILPYTMSGSTLGWVRIGLSLKEYSSGVSIALRDTVSTVIFAALGGIAGSFFLARRITRPLGGLCDLAQGIAGGDFGRRTKFKTSGEVQLLADHMDWMAENLEENRNVILGNQRDLEEANAKLSERVENESLLSRISTDFLHAEGSVPDPIFVSGLARIAARLKIDGASIFLYDPADHTNLVRAWEWHSAEAPLCNIERVPIAGFRWAIGRTSELAVLTIADSTSLPDEARAERINLERLGIRSAAAAVLGTGEKEAGYLFLRSHSGPRSWTAEEEQVIQFAAGIFSHAIARREAALEREKLHGQLLQAQKMEAVGKLSGGIAHDFNNMLVPIVGYSDSILRNSPENAPWTNEIREIKRAAESAAALTRQLLTFSRKQIISRKELDLNSLIQTVQCMLRRTIGENIKLETGLAPDLWSIAADAGQIEQCLVNLTVNAKAAMPDGGVIRISTEMLDSEDAEFSPPPARKIQGLFIRLSVQDSGHGMDETTLARIFEPFFSTKGLEGTGLGLSVVHGVVEEHGGWITVESKPGQGTAFHLWLPALHEPTPQPMDSGLAIAPPLAKGSGQRILLVEDEPGVLAFVSAALRQNGYVIVAADCGEAARRIFNEEANRIDLVMSDVMLPDASGVDLLEEFYGIKPSLKALLTSGYNEKNALVELVRKRGLFFLHKPYTLIQLLEAVQNALHGPSRVVVT